MESARQPATDLTRSINDQSAADLAVLDAQIEAIVSRMADAPAVDLPLFASALGRLQFTRRSLIQWQAKQSASPGASPEAPAMTDRRARGKALAESLTAA